MKAKEFIIELKKESKPRNFVAKNASLAGKAGQHKDKKKAEKQGDVKHKKEIATMESALNELSSEKLAQYKKAAGADAKKADADGNYSQGDKRFKGINRATNKQFDNDRKKHSVAEASLGDYREKAQKQKAQSRMGAMFNDPDALATFNKRERGLNRLKARDEVARKSTADKQMADNIAKLPELKAEYERMKAEYKSLGGSNWQYADREQNLTDREREARSMEGPMNNLWRTISAAEKAQKNQGVGEGWKDKVAAAGLAGAMAFGAGSANARVTPGDDPSINRLTGKPIATQQATDTAPAKAEAPKGFSKEYLQAVVDGKHPRPMVSVEKAQQLLKQMDSKVGEGSMFAGAKVGHKEGPAGQWRNDGAKKNKPAKPGDLVGDGM